MTNILSFNVRLLFRLAFVGAVLFMGVQFIFAQEVSPAPQESPQAVAAPAPGEVTYPIPELGSCGDFTSCSHYCEDPVNQTSCINYAQLRGFYEIDPVLVGDEELLGRAQAVLGCDSFESCMQFCEDPVNHAACDTFATEENLTGGYIDDPGRPEYIAIATEVLGCDSLESCSAACDDPANSAECTEFAHRVGLEGGEVQEGPGRMYDS